MPNKTTDRKSPDRSPEANLDAAIDQLTKARVKLIAGQDEATADKVKAIIESVKALKDK